MAVFGVLERDGAVYAQVIADCDRATLRPITRRRVAPGSVVCSDSWLAYDMLWVWGCRHERVNHGEELAAGGRRPIGGIENFWSQAKRHRRRFSGVPKGSFPLFRRESVWRHDTGAAEDQLKSLRSLLRRK